MADDDAGAANVATDVAGLQAYLVKVCSTAFGIPESDSEAGIGVAKEMLSTFQTDSSQTTLYVSAVEEDGRSKLEVSLDAGFPDAAESAVVFLKLSNNITGDADVASQLRFVKLPRKGFINALYLMTQKTFMPMLQAAEESESGNADIKKKLAELTLSLRMAQQSVDVPDVVLGVDPEVEKRVASAGSGRVGVDIFNDLLDDSNDNKKRDMFIGGLEKHVQQWTRDIQKVLKLDNDEEGIVLASNEVSFWLAMERVLKNIKEQMERRDVELMVEILAQKKRVMLIEAYKEAKETSDKAYQKVKSIITVMGGFPITKLLAATSLVEIQSALTDIFEKLGRVKYAQYPLARAVLFADAIGRDMCSQMVSVLGNKRLMILEYTTFQKRVDECKAVFTDWEKLGAKFIDMITELEKKRSKTTTRKNRSEKRKLASLELAARVEELYNFRHSHHQLKQVLATVMSSSQSDIDDAYDKVAVVDVMDTTTEGTRSWNDAKEIYGEKTDDVEMQVAASLRDKLGAAKNANEMFAVFRKFKELLKRDKIKDTVHEYQSELFSQVEADVKALMETFRQKYKGSETDNMCTIRDFPSHAGHAVWSRQIRRQLLAYANRIEDIMGSDWGPDTASDSGRKLWSICEKFYKKLDELLGSSEEGDKVFRRDDDEFMSNYRPKHENAGRIFGDWQTDTLTMFEKSFHVTERLLKIESMPGSSDDRLDLKVTFDIELLNVIKEMRNFSFMGFKVHHRIKKDVNNVSDLHPSAMQLREAVQLYKNVLRNMSDDPDNLKLISRSVQKVHEHVHKLIPKTWREMLLDVGGDGQDKQRVQLMTQEHPKKIVGKLHRDMLNLDSSVNTFLAMQTDVKAALAKMESGPYTLDTFEEPLTKIQEIVDELDMQSFTNVGHWAKKIDDRVTVIMNKRINQALEAWHLNFKESMGEAESADKPLLRRRSSVFNSATLMGGASEVLQTPEINLQIKLQKSASRRGTSKLRVEPVVENVRQSLVAHLHNAIGVVANQHRVTETKMDSVVVSTAYGEPDVVENFMELLSEMDQIKLQEIYNDIERLQKQCSSFVAEWLNYQSLWLVDSADIADACGNSLSKWVGVVTSLRQQKQQLRGDSAMQSFGPVAVEYGEVRSSIEKKMASWLIEIQKLMAEKLGETGGKINVDIDKARVDLEQLNLTGSTSEAMAGLLKMQDLKNKKEAWEEALKVMREAQELLHKGKHEFSDDWLDVETVKVNFDSFMEHYGRRDKQMREIKTKLINTLAEENQKLEEAIARFNTEWATKKPMNATNAAAAINEIEGFEERLESLKKESKRIQEANELLGVPAPTHKLKAVAEEIKDLRGVWEVLAEVSKSLVEAGNTPWAMFNPQQTREKLDAIVDQIKQFRPYIRQYEACRRLEKDVQDRISTNALLGQLKGGKVRERHWKIIMDNLKVNWNMNDLYLRDMWASGMQQNEGMITDVLRVAQGEGALESFLQEVKDFWTEYELTLVNFQGKCKLIKGWDDIFAKVTEHLGQLEGMAASPFFKPFEESHTSLNEKLNKVKAAFDVWIEVQRRFVYLEGIFVGSAEIKQQLPGEYTRFKAIEKEFLNLCRKTAVDPMILAVADIENLQETLENLEENLTLIQKALGDFLESQRAQFSRFYFIGDDDLLEIIGNAQKEPRTLQKHLAKLFAGISQLVFTDEVEQPDIVAMCSREGERVDFVKPVSIKKNPKIYNWLNAVETEMRNTLANLVGDATRAIPPPEDGEAPYMDWIDKFPGQCLIVAMKVDWGQRVDAVLASCNELSESDLPAAQEKSKTDLDPIVDSIQKRLDLLADRVLKPLDQKVRKKLEVMVSELVFQRTVTTDLQDAKICNNQDFNWLHHLRFGWNDEEQDVQKKLQIGCADANFFYGFEYLGATENMIQTPVTERIYLTLTQALSSKMGGCPFGPAGTGKTATVVSLAGQMGRFVLTFNCDENFDFNSMGRIFVGLCRVGAWGCFDEFNRLEERMLSAVSQQILNIQQGIRDKKATIELLGRNTGLDPNVGIFITMNLGYAGRSVLPANLKDMFRNIACTKPNAEVIARVFLLCQGYRTASSLAGRIVLLFNLCKDQLSAQPHYDFGLRSIKPVLNSAGNLKRRLSEEQGRTPEDPDNADFEMRVLLQSLVETLTPKLVGDDVVLLNSLLKDVFPGIDYKQMIEADLRKHVEEECDRRSISHKDADGNDNAWIKKVWQLYGVNLLHHGLMVVGPSGCGKSQAWRVLLYAMEKVSGIKYDHYILDPKAFDKNDLYGFMDNTTMEWTDGVFTSILRTILTNVRGEMDRRHWIIFDGDVDAVWVENLNSCLDDGKILTLPNGERLSIPHNLHLCFEVQDLKFATLATVSRCQMVWFAEETVGPYAILQHYIDLLRKEPIAGVADFLLQGKGGGQSPAIKIQNEVADAIQEHLGERGFVLRAYEAACALNHVMEFSMMRALNSMWSLLTNGIRHIHAYNEEHMDFQLPTDTVQKYAVKRLVFAATFGFGGDFYVENRFEFGNLMMNICSEVDLPLTTEELNLVDFEVYVSDGEWHAFDEQVPVIDCEHQKINDGYMVIPTIDTVRNKEIAASWMADQRPMLFCGPPGSGKTMTLTTTLSAMPEVELCGINFSEGTMPELILQTFEQYCTCSKGAKGWVMKPNMRNKWLVLFCDEINLPKNDQYGTQRVIMFLRQMVEQRGFWRAKDCQWITIERIQFVGACNPPTDPGRVALSLRFLRHAPVLLVDLPTQVAMKQIYGTFVRALLKVPAATSLSDYAENTTDAIVEMYGESRKNFNTSFQPHYIYSPRELSRYLRGLYKAMLQYDVMTVEDLVRLVTHEGLRLFYDRLVEDENRELCFNFIDKIMRDNFPNCNHDEALAHPMLYSKWVTGIYESVTIEDLRAYVLEQLQRYGEETGGDSSKMVIHDDLLEHMLRVDRVLNVPIGHVLAMGTMGWGRNTLVKFVAWLNRQQSFAIKISKNYMFEDFEADIRIVMKMCGVANQEVVFHFNEMKDLGPAMIERMNALLASGEVPGLFDGEEYTSLMTDLKQAAQRDGTLVDSEEEMFKGFTKKVQKNLHIVFTMTDAAGGGSSPALFNRCVVDWYGTRWNEPSMLQAAAEWTKDLDIDLDGSIVEYLPLPDEPEFLVDTFTSDLHAKFSRICVRIHVLVEEACVRVGKLYGQVNHMSPRSYLDFINHFVRLFEDKTVAARTELNHLTNGIEKLKQTEEEVGVMQEQLARETEVLNVKNKQAEEKLAQIMEDQADVDKKKEIAEKAQVDVARIKEEVAVESKKVSDELASVQPMVDKAKQAVSGLSKKNIDSLKQMKKPHPRIMNVAKMVGLMIGEKETGWQAMVSTMRKKDFITRVVELGGDDITEKARKEIMKMFEDPDFTYEMVNRASTALGPLHMWAEAMLSYSRVLNSIEPLTTKKKNLEKEANELEAKGNALVKEVDELTAKVAELKADYSKMIGEVERLKTKMEETQVAVQRSVEILANLSTEAVRWKEDAERNAVELPAVSGDCLIAAATICYGGFFDQVERGNLRKKWLSMCKESDIEVRESMLLTTLCTIPDDLQLWKSQGMPDDELALENACIIAQANRFPLVIDPDGYATDYLMNHLADKNVVKTSFLDEAFVKSLESAIRFGNALVIQDVDAMDPIVNPLLNGDFIKSGSGGKAVSVGPNDIDYSPSFSLFLVTRDPTTPFSPELCSRVTFVNFTTTPASMEEQCLDRIMVGLRPDVDEKRRAVKKAQSELVVKLQRLGRELLNTLSNSTGNLLSDDALRVTLDKLKTESEVAEKAKKANETILQEVEEVLTLYRPLAKSMRMSYFALDQLSFVAPTYQFSLSQFMVVFARVLDNMPKSEGGSDAAALTDLTNSLFTQIYLWFCKALRQDDHPLLALRLSQILLEQKNVFMPDAVLTYAISGGAGTMGPSDTSRATAKDIAAAIGVDQAVEKEMASLLAIPGMDGMINSLKSQTDAWKEFIQHTVPEEHVPKDWQDAQESMSANAYNDTVTLAMTKLLRPDRVFASTKKLIGRVLGPSLLTDGTALDFNELILNEVTASIPVLVIAATGMDASGKIEEIAREQKVNLRAMAMGTAEMADDAAKAVVTGSKQGSWVMLKNIHLDRNFLVQLAKSLLRLRPKPSFRLFLTSDITDRLPVPLLHQSRIVFLEKPVGVKPNLLRSLMDIPASRMDARPSERPRLYFLLCWLHAVLQERIRYMPVGWTKVFEFGESDRLGTLNMVDRWLDTAAQGREHLGPERIPWLAITRLTSQTLYGGRVDNHFDQVLLDSFLDKLLFPGAYEYEFGLTDTDETTVGTEQDLKIPPDATCHSHYIAFAKGLPDDESPMWLGLPPLAERMLLRARGEALLSRFGRIRFTGADEGDDEEDSPADDTADDDAPKTGGWYVSLESILKVVMKQINSAQEKSVVLQPTAQGLKDPLYRFFMRESKGFAACIKKVKAVLEELIAAGIEGENPTAQQRELIQLIGKDIVPPRWKSYTVTDMGLAAWTADLDARVTALEPICSSQAFRPTEGLWVGGLAGPAAWITATCQTIAQIKKVPLGDLSLVLDLGDASNTTDSFSMKGMRIEGAEFDSAAKSIKSATQISSNLPGSRIRWLTGDELTNWQGESKTMLLPVYMSSNRKNLAFTATVKAPPGVPINTWFQRGIALITWDPLAQM